MLRGVARLMAPLLHGAVGCEFTIDLKVLADAACGARWRRYNTLSKHTDVARELNLRSLALFGKLSVV